MEIGSYTTKNVSSRVSFLSNNNKRQRLDVKFKFRRGRFSLDQSGLKAVWKQLQSRSGRDRPPGGVERKKLRSTDAHGDAIYAFFKARREGSRKSCGQPVMLYTRGYAQLRLRVRIYDSSPAKITGDKVYRALREVMKRTAAAVVCWSTLHV